MAKPSEYLAKPYGRVVVPESDGTYRAEIMEFPGCIATGDTAIEALENLENVAESWLEATLAKHQRVPEPLEVASFSGKTVLRLAKSLHKQAAYAAAHDGVSLNTFIANCVAQRVGCGISGVSVGYLKPMSAPQHRASVTFQVGHFYQVGLHPTVSEPSGIQITRLPMKDAYARG